MKNLLLVAATIFSTFAATPRYINLNVDTNTFQAYPNAIALTPTGASNYIALASHMAIYKNIEHFGAVSGADGNALTNRNALQRALLAAGSGVVLVPAKTYKIQISPLPIHLGYASIKGIPGSKFQFSMPSDYTNGNSYVSTELYTGSSLVDSNGTVVSYASTNFPYSNMPWNGKGLVFTHGTNNTIEGLTFDGGWGTTDGLSGTIAITGVRDDNEEFTYYQFFNNLNGTKIRHNVFNNIMGAVFEILQNVDVSHNEFTHYGDHVLYTQGGATNITFANNLITLTRASTGTLGQTNYVFDTFRDAVKLRGTTAAKVTDNTMIDYNSVASLVTVEVNSTQAGDANRIHVQRNNFIGSVFITLDAHREAGTADERIKNTIISDNIANVTDKFIDAESAFDGLFVFKNTVTNVTGSFANIYGHPRWRLPLKNIFIEGNYFTTSNTANAIAITGIGEDIFITRNTFKNKATPTSSTHVLGFTSGGAIDGVPISTLPFAIANLSFRDNIMSNYFSSGTDAGHAAYAASTNYTYTQYIMTGETNEVYSVVSSGGALYYNTNTTVGVAPPSAPWVPYTRGATRIESVGNIRYSSAAGLSPNNSAYVFYLSAPSAELKSTYTAFSRFDKHINSLGEAVSYSFANATRSRDTIDLYASTVDVSTINNLTTVTGVGDMTINTSGSGDEIDFFNAVTGAYHLDIGQGSSGTVDLRIFNGAAVVMTLADSGAISSANITLSDLSADRVTVSDSTDKLVSSSVTTNQLHGALNDYVTAEGTVEVRLDTLEISTSSSPTNISNLGGGAHIGQDISANILRLNTLTNGSNISISSNANLLTITATDTGVTNLTTSGGGQHLIQGISGTTITANTITNGAGITISSNANLITITSSGFTAAPMMAFAASDETTDLTTGNAKITLRAPRAFAITGVRASVNTASSSGALTIDINEGGSTIFSTLLTIDANEETSVSAATPAVLSDTSMADDAEITLDIDGAGTGAKGLKIIIYGTLP